MNTDPSTQKLVLLIEDEEIMANLLQARLTKAGYLVKTARDGERGLSLVRELRPDLVLLDMMLPKLNGFGVLERLSEEKIIPKMPVIVISNSGQPIELERILGFGIRDYLIKVNFDPNEVCAKVSSIFEEMEEQKRAPRAPVSRGRAGGAENILIIEDDYFLSELLGKKFSQRGYAVLGARDAGQARKILASHRISLILLDVVLPGMDGFTFLSELKQDERYRSIPVIIISNLGQQDAVERGKQAGAADYIIKANTMPDEIVKRVDAVLESRKQ